MVEQPRNDVVPVAAGGRDTLGGEQMRIAVACELVARACVGLRSIPTIVRNVVGGQQQGEMLSCGLPCGVYDIVKHGWIEPLLAGPGQTLRSTLAGIQEHAHGIEATHTQFGEDSGDVGVAVDSYSEAA